MTGMSDANWRSASRAGSAHLKLEQFLFLILNYIKPEKETSS